MTKEEWLVEFQVLNGRRPTDQEMLEASKNNFETMTSAVAKKSFKIEPSLFLKIAIGFIVAIFGYVVGYLFM
ncbi:hypothetical protein [Streptococcus orisratti]|uniref:hypothetical protein n=1 Tax=Streptococcus orisratti TaxID=114652 RepID=UPI0023561328|nr:hypothetical protein [Streptococcus orisratti]MCI7678460.1 hypothetical protein [Streptococcus orisratti]MDY4002665.1 hypothetical protein [Streptococcus orisratti]MDY5636837.1 hypothetical protein [Streptococcus orisratti]